MAELKRRKIQSKVKHEILSEYMEKWWSIISTGLARYYRAYGHRMGAFRARFVYVDYFAYSGVYAPENGKLVYGSPVIGVRSLDKLKTHMLKTAGLEPFTAAILIEEDPETYDQLIATLNGVGFGDRIRQIKHIKGLSNGDIVVIKGDSSEYVDQILEFINEEEHTFSFHFIDPYGTKAIPFHTVSRIVAQKRADCIINLMYEPMSRRIRLVAKENLTPAEKAHLQYFDRLFGSQVWRETAEKLVRGEIDSRQAEFSLTSLYAQLLQDYDPDPRLTIKNIPLKYEEADKVGYYLNLTTHDPTGALTMNEILDDARIRDYDYRVDKRLTSSEGFVQTTMFGDLGLRDVKRPTEPEVDIEALAKRIRNECGRRTLLYRDILQTLANTPFYLEDVRRALGHLKKEGLAHFDVSPSQLTNDKSITLK